MKKSLTERTEATDVKLVTLLEFAELIETGAGETRRVKVSTVVSVLPFSTSYDTNSFTLDNNGNVLGNLGGAKSETFGNGMKRHWEAVNKFKGKYLGYDPSAR